MAAQGLVASAINTGRFFYGTIFMSGENYRKLTGIIYIFKFGKFHIFFRKLILNICRPYTTTMHCIITGTCVRVIQLMLVFTE